MKKKIFSRNLRENGDWRFPQLLFQHSFIPIVFIEYIYVYIVSHSISLSFYFYFPSLNVVCSPRAIRTPQCRRLWSSALPWIVYSSLPHNNSHHCLYFFTLSPSSSHQNPLSSLGKKNDREREREMRQLKERKPRCES